MNETLAAEIVRARSDACEICDAAVGTDFSHRIGRGQGGPWTPSNGIRACRRCHNRIHARPEYAMARGWMLPGHADPTTTPALLRTWFGEWWVILTDEGMYEMQDRPTTDLLEWNATHETV